MKKELSLLICGLLSASAIVSASSVTAFAAPKVDPYKTVQAEMTFGNSGLTDKTEGDVRFLANLGAGDYTRIKDVDFSAGMAAISVNVRSASVALLEVRLDAVDGEKLGSIKISGTNGSFKTFTSKMANVTGKHEIYFVGKIGTVDFDYWTAVTAPGTVIPEDPTPVEPAPSVISPYETVQAEVATDVVNASIKSENGVTFISGIKPGAMMSVKNLAFEGSAAFGLTYKTNNVSIVEVRDAKLAGEKLATLRLSNTNGQFVTKYFQFADLSGSHDLFFVGTFGETDIDSFVVLKAPVKPNPSQEDPTPEDPEPVDPTPVDPTPVDPTPVDPTPVVTADLDLQYDINSWGTGFTVNFKVVNSSDEAVNGWSVRIKKSDISIDSAWCVKVTEDGDYYVITPDDWNASIRPGESAFFGVQGSGSIGSSIDFEF